jgi:ADP-glucose pyrophosphorylase
MKRIAIWTVPAIMLWAIIIQVQAQAQTENHPNESQKVFHGEVSDSQCALNVHSLTRSHQEMLKSKSMGGTAASCSLYCIKNLGGELVLSSGKTVYRLDKQDMAREMVGQKAKITGTLDPKTKTIRVEKIELEIEAGK